MDLPNLTAEQAEAAEQLYQAIRVNADAKIRELAVLDDVPNSVESRDGDRDGFSCYPALARSTRSLSLQGSSRAAFSIQRC